MDADAGTTRSPRPIYAIFEGGGAKGVAHVGALKAIKANHLEIIGVAGTSAGALAAVLVSLGYEASDLMDEKDPTKHILSPMTPVGVLGEYEWRRLKWVRSFGLAPVVGLALGGVIPGALFSPCNTSTFLHTIRHMGLFSTTGVLKVIEDRIHKRLTEINEVAKLGRVIPERITFKELASWPTILPLKIVVTDVDEGTLEVFDSDATPDVIVAEAVAASISIPIAFRPALIPSFRPGRFADGGMVSNLPIWAFAEDKLAYEREHFSDAPVATIGFTLDAPDPKAAPWWKPAWLRRIFGTLGGDFIGYLRKLLHASLQGSQGTTLQFIEDVNLIRLKTELDTLDFDKSWADYDEARTRGFEIADKHLKFLLEAKPDKIGSVLASVQAEVINLVNKMRQTTGKGPIDQLRVNLMEPAGRHSLRIFASVGMEQDADDRLLLDRRGRGAADAFRRSDLLVFKLGKKFNRPSAEFMTKYERALVRKTVKTVVCVPIFKDPTAWGLAPAKRGPPQGILAIDCDVDIASELSSPQIKAMLTKRSDVLYAAISEEV